MGAAFYVNLQQKSEHCFLLCCAGERFAGPQWHSARRRNRLHVVALVGGSEEVPYSPPTNQQPAASHRHSFR